MIKFSVEEPQTGELATLHDFIFFLFAIYLIDAYDLAMCTAKDSVIYTFFKNILIHYEHTLSTSTLNKYIMVYTIYSFNNEQIQILSTFKLFS